MIRYKVYFTIICMLVTACTSRIRPDDVQEYRYLPEYDGYVPIVISESGRINIHADWVLPTLDAEGKPSLRLPKTAAQAKSIVTERADKENRQSAALAPLQIISAPLILPAFLIADSADHMSWDSRENKKIEGFNHLAGVKVDLKITDEKGRPVTQAQVHELPGNLVYRKYTDASGRRSFAAPEIHYYKVPKSVIRKRAKHLPVSLGRGGDLSKHDYMGYGSTGYGTKKTANSSERVKYTSKLFAAFAGYSKENGWQWLHPPSAQDLYIVVWAPGYSSKLLAIKGVKPRSLITKDIKLVPLSHRDKLQQVGKKLGEVLDDLFKGKYERVYQGLSWDKPYAIRQWRLPENKLQEINHQLVTWLGDESLPVYFRWNIYQILKDIVRYTKDEVALSHSKRFEKQAAAWFPYIHDGTDNPNRFDKKLQKWKYGYCSSDSIPRRQRASDAENIRTIKMLLKKGVALDATNPALHELRVVYELKNGRREKAFSYAAYLDHMRYFHYFYGCEYSVWAYRY